MSEQYEIYDDFNYEVIERVGIMMNILFGSTFQAFDIRNMQKSVASRTFS